MTHHRASFLLLLVILLAMPAVATAHSGGAAVLADVDAGPYRLFAYVQPELLLVGPAHIAVAVTLPPQDQAADGLLTPVTDAQVWLRWEPSGQPERAFRVEALSQSALSDTFYETDVAIPFAGLWRVTIEVTGPPGQGTVSFERTVTATRPINWRLVGAAGAVLVLLLGLIWGWQRRRKE